MVFEGRRLTGGWPRCVRRAARRTCGRRPWPASFYPGTPRDVQVRAGPVVCQRFPRRPRRSRGQGAPGAARRLGLFGQAGRGRLQPDRDSPIARSFFARNTGRAGRVGRWRRIGGGCSRAASWPRTPNWPRGWPTVSKGWNSTRRPIARNTPSRCSCRCWPGWPRAVRVVGITVGDLRPAGTAAVRRGDVGGAARHARSGRCWWFPAT